MSRDNSGYCMVPSKNDDVFGGGLLLLASRTTAPFVSISKITFVPVSIRPVHLFVYEHHIARSAAAAVSLSKYRAVRATDDWLHPVTPRALLE